MPTKRAHSPGGPGGPGAPGVTEDDSEDHFAPPGGETANTSALVVAKKARSDHVVATQSSGQKVVEASGPPRTSNMEAPIMQLNGHSGEIYCAKFHPEGNFLASAGFDRQILFWNVYGDCENYHFIPSAHAGAILDLQFSYEDGAFLYTASTDKTVGVFDTQAGVRMKRLKGHASYVNSVHPARRGDPLLVSGSDDCSIKVWDQRRRGPVHTLNSTYQVTAVSFNDTADQVLSGGIDNQVKMWDLRKPASPSFTLSGHTDTITSMALSPDGSYLLTNAMDSTLRVWDVRPFAPEERCVKIIGGHQHNFEKNLLRCAWSPDGAMVASGSADKNVYIWDTTSRRILYKLPGHLGSVNDVDFHKIEPIVLSASSDKSIFLGEFEG